VVIHYVRLFVGGCLTGPNHRIEIATMTDIASAQSSVLSLKQRTGILYCEQHLKIARRTDRMFAVLMILQ
jgi:hypothetical protein